MSGKGHYALSMSVDWYITIIILYIFWKLVALAGVLLNISYLSQYTATAYHSYPLYLTVQEIYLLEIGCLKFY